ncbi:MAG: ADP-ribosylglycohydrolase family protein [Calditrichia bacterium]
MKLQNLDIEKYKEHALGCLLGVACGDAMGMPTSMLSPDEIRNIFPERITSFLPAPEGHVIHNGMVAGQITDDTQQAMILVKLFLEEGRISRDGVARKLIEWGESLNAFDSLILGPSSLRALKMIREGVPVDEAGYLGDTNGAAMRIAPIGVINPGNLQRTLKDVIEVCVPTHNTNIAIAGASAVACAVSAGMAGASLDELIEAFFYGIKEGMAYDKKWFGASLTHRTEWALDIARSGKREETIWQDLYNYIGAGVAITEAVPTALALVVYYGGDPVRTIEAATNMGGDCDTVGAIAGGIAGAYSGAGNFPLEFLEKIEAINNLHLNDHVSRLAERVLAGMEILK